MRTADRLVSGIRALMGQDGRFYVLWGDEGRRDWPLRDREIHLSSFSNNAWSEARVVTDEKAIPVTFWGEMDLWVESIDNIHVFWTDLREKHWFLSLFDAGEFEKVFHRAKRDGVWGKTRKVQRRGKFFVSSPRVAQDAQGGIHLFWAEEIALGTPSGRGDVFHAFLIGDKWSTPEQISDNRNYDDTHGSIAWIDVARGPRGALYAAWRGRRYADRSRVEGVLEFRTLLNGRWSEGTVLSRRSGRFVWMKGQDGLMSVVFQEYPASSMDLEERTGFALYYVPMTEKGVGERQLIADETAVELFDAVVDVKGNQHVVFVQPGPDQRMHLLHRVLNAEGRPPTDGATSTELGRVRE